MSSDWQTVAIGSLCLGIYDGPHATPKKTTEGPVFLGISSLNNGQLDLTSLEYLSEDDFAKWTKRVVPRTGDIVFSYETRLGQVAVIPDGLRCCLGRRMALMRVDPEKVIPDYLLYAYLSPDFQDVIRQRTIHGSTVDRIPLVEFGSFPISVPPLDVQKDVVATLRALDDRITLLRETNATLEAIAQALFKSWFVDFDPVRARMEGRAPEGMDEATAALFPAGLEESELGLMPRGWRVGTVSDFAQQHKGSINPLRNPEMLYEHFSLPAFDNQQMPVSELGTEIKSNKTSVPSDAVLLSKLNPHIPRVWLPVDVGRHGVCSTEFLVFVPVGGSSKEFIYCAFTIAKFKELLCQLVTGTSNSHQRVKPDGVSTMSAVIPQSEVLKAFSTLVKPMFERIGHNRGEAQTLATLRDTLLPRLISGQLWLPETEAVSAG